MCDRERESSWKKIWVWNHHVVLFRLERRLLKPLGSSKVEKNISKNWVILLLYHTEFNFSIHPILWTIRFPRVLYIFPLLLTPSWNAWQRLTVLLWISYVGMCYAQWNIQYFLLLLCECSHKKRINKIYQIYNGLTRLNIIQNLFQCDHQYMYILFNPMWFKVFTSTSRREREKNQQKNSKIVSLFAVQINILFVLFSSCSTDGNINKLHVNF